MNPLIFVILLFIVLAVAAIGVLLLGGKGGSSLRDQMAASDNLRSLVASQRDADGFRSGGSEARQNLAIAAAAEGSESSRKKSSTSKMTLERKIHYAQWTIRPLHFRTVQIITTLVIVIIFRSVIQTGVFLQVIALLFTPMLISSVIDRAVSKRFLRFDADYPVMLLQFVSLLKTGMNSVGGLEAAGKGLDKDSLVRAEIELLIERLKLGLTEEQAINSFGEDVAHPEIELFVQSLILSRRVGGTLSDTLERLAKQVRKRQQFRQQAEAAVGMERGSIYMIAAIMTALLIYLAYSQPVLIFPALKDPVGRKVFEGGLGMIFVGFFWSKKVTNIKI